MNRYVRRLLGILFEKKPARQSMRPQPQQLPTPSLAWREYWQAKGLPWRTEPEIGVKRQEELSSRRALVPDMKRGPYPLKGIPLSRADVEWLLATHEHGRGPVDWSDEQQRQRVGLDLRGADLRQANLAGLPLARMLGGLTELGWLATTEEQRSAAAVHLEGASLKGAQLQGASLQQARLQGADLWEAQLQQATLVDARLQGAALVGARLQGADLWGAQLQGADLSRADLDRVTLDEVTLSDQAYGPALLADINWGEVNLAVVDWGQMTRLGDERLARRKRDDDGNEKGKGGRVGEYQDAVRANRQLAVVLQEQGLNEEAARFAYRAQVLQREVYKLQVRQGQMRQMGAWLFSWFLALLTGYGYRIWRMFVAYGVLIGLFAAIYYLSLGSDHLAWYQQVYQALVVSVTAFHGRTYAGQYGPGTALGGVAALEGIFGLVIEGVFIAMLVQRFFGK